MSRIQKHRSANQETIRRATRALAESVESIIDGDRLDAETIATLAETFAQAEGYLLEKCPDDSVRTEVSKNATAGDEAEGLRAPPVGGHHRPITMDIGDQRLTFPNERALAVWLSVQERLTKSHTTEAPMPNLSDIVKAHGVIALAKYMCEQNSSFGATEHELVALATADAARKYPTDTEAMAFTKLYTESRELRDAIDIAKGELLKDAIAEELERDSRKACEELSAIGKQRWPNLSPSQRFARAFETHPDLAKRAHRRPGPSVSHPHPVTKDLAAPVVDPKPVFVGDDAALDVDDPRKAVEQLKEAGRRRWPTATVLEQFERALTDPENAELVRRAFARPTGSSPPRQS